MKTLGNFVISLTVILFLSCGPRSGIHNDTTEKSDENKQFFCGNATDNSPQSSNGHKLFKQNCAVCHSSHSDQRFTGPGLKGVFDRVPSEEWFISYTLNCDSVNKSGDKYAKKLRKEYKEITMTNFSGYLTKADIENIVVYLKSSNY